MDSVASTHSSSSSLRSSSTSSTSSSSKTSTSSSEGSLASSALSSLTKRSPRFGGVDSKRLYEEPTRVKGDADEERPHPIVSHLPPEATSQNVKNEPKSTTNGTASSSSSTSSSEAWEPLASSASKASLRRESMSSYASTGGVIAPQESPQVAYSIETPQRSSQPHVGRRVSTASSMGSTPFKSSQGEPAMISPLAPHRLSSSNSLRRASNADKQLHPITTAVGGVDTCNSMETPPRCSNRPAVARESLHSANRSCSSRTSRSSVDEGRETFVVSPGVRRSSLEKQTSDSVCRSTSSAEVFGMEIAAAPASERAAQMEGTDYAIIGASDPDVEAKPRTVTSSGSYRNAPDATSAAAHTKAGAPPKVIPKSRAVNHSVQSKVTTKPRRIEKEGAYYGLKGDPTLKQLLKSNSQLRRLHHEANRMAKMHGVNDALDGSDDSDEWEFDNIRGAVAAICDAASLKIRAAGDGSDTGSEECVEESRLVTTTEGNAEIDSPVRSPTRREFSSARSIACRSSLRFNDHVRPCSSSASKQQGHVPAWIPGTGSQAGGSGVFKYDALLDPHCESFHSQNQSFQQHWAVMEKYLRPNQRVAQRVTNAMVPVFDSPRDQDCRGVGLATSLQRNRSAARHQLTTSTLRLASSAPIARKAKNRQTELHEQETSVNVVNANTFFDRRREHLAQGLPAVVRKPLEALAEQLKGPGGTMKASAGEPWPPERVGPAIPPKPLPPRPPPRRQSSARIPPSRPSTAASQGTCLTISSRPSSSPSVAFGTPAPPRIGSAEVKKFDARSPFLKTEPNFTIFDAQFFPDATAMREGTAPPSPYVFSAEFAQRPRSGRVGPLESRHRDGGGTGADVVPVTPLLKQQELAAKATQSLDILTETHINIVCRCEDYGRRDLIKREAARFAVIASSYSARSAFFLTRHRQRNAIADAEAYSRNDILSDQDVQLLKVLHQARKEFISAKLSEEVFPQCPVLCKNESMPIVGSTGSVALADSSGSSDLHFIVDLRWAGNEVDAATLSILVFDWNDRYVCAVSKGDSLRCPVSGRAVVRSWNNYKFRSQSESSATQRASSASSRGTPLSSVIVSHSAGNANQRTSPGDLGHPSSPSRTKNGPRKSSAAVTFEGFPLHETFTPPESRSTFEVLLGNLHPSAAFRRFVFVVSNPTKTGGLLTAMNRPYLTVRAPYGGESISNVLIPAVYLRQSGADSKSGRPPLPGVAGSNTGKQRIQADTRVSEMVAVRLPDRPNLSCFTIASFVRTKPSTATTGNRLHLTMLSPTPSEYARDAFLQVSSASSPVDNGPPSTGWINFPSRPTSGRHQFGSGGWQSRPNSAARSPHESSLGDTSSQDVTTPTAQSSEWSLVCHDHADPSVPNLLRLPHILEATLFVDKNDLWFAFVSSAIRIERTSDEFFEKVLRQSIELQERYYRERIGAVMRQAKEAIENRGSRSALAEAMIKNAYSKKVVKPRLHSPMVMDIDPLAASSVLLPIADNAPMDVSLRRQQSSLKMAAVLVGRARAAKQVLRRKSKGEAVSPSASAEVNHDFNDLITS